MRRCPNKFSHNNNYNSRNRNVNFNCYVCRYWTENDSLGFSSSHFMMRWDEQEEEEAGIDDSPGFSWVKIISHNHILRSTALTSFIIECVLLRLIRTEAKESEENGKLPRNRVLSAKFLLALFWQFVIPSPSSASGFLSNLGPTRVIFLSLFLKISIRDGNPFVDKYSFAFAFSKHGFASIKERACTWLEYLINAIFLL